MGSGYGRIGSLAYGASCRIWAGGAVRSPGYPVEAYSPVRPNFNIAAGMPSVESPWARRILDTAGDSRHWRLSAHLGTRLRGCATGPDSSGGDVPTAPNSARGARSKSGAHFDRVPFRVCPNSICVASRVQRSAPLRRSGHRDANDFSGTRLFKRAGAGRHGGVSGYQIVHDEDSQSFDGFGA